MKTQKFLSYDQFVAIDGKNYIQFQVKKTKYTWSMALNTVTGNVDRRTYRHPAFTGFFPAGLTLRQHLNPNNMNPKYW